MIQRLLAALACGAILLSPALAGAPARLFTIERNYNRNVVVYEANVTASGTLDTLRPVKAYWMMHEENRGREGLNFIEWNSAYGFDLQTVTAGMHYRMCVKSFRERAISILCEGSTPRAVMDINGRKGYLSKIFVFITKGAILPRVQHVELFGLDVVSGKRLYEKILNAE